MDSFSTPAFIGLLLLFFNDQIFIPYSTLNFLHAISHFFLGNQLHFDVIFNRYWISQPRDDNGLKPWLVKVQQATSQFINVWSTRQRYFPNCFLFWCVRLDLDKISKSILNEYPILQIEKLVHKILTSRWRFSMHTLTQEKILLTQMTIWFSTWRSISSKNQCCNPRFSITKSSFQNTDA